MKNLLRFILTATILLNASIMHGMYISSKNNLRKRATIAPRQIMKYSPQKDKENLKKIDLSIGYRKKSQGYHLNVQIEDDGNILAENIINELRIKDKNLLCLKIQLLHLGKPIDNKISLTSLNKEGGLIFITFDIDIPEIYSNNSTAQVEEIFDEIDNNAQKGTTFLLLKDKNNS